MQVLQQIWKEIDSGQNWNYEGNCNACGITAFWNPNVINLDTGKKMTLLERYYPGTGMIPKVHYPCPKMKKGQFHKYVKNGQEYIPKCKWCGSTKKSHDSFYNDLLILEKDNWMVVAEKKKRQRNTRNFDYINSIERYEVPMSWYSHSFEY